MTDQELRDEFEKIASINGFNVKIEDHASHGRIPLYKYDVTMSAWIIFKKGYSLAQETIEKQKKEIEEQTKTIISNGKSLMEYEAEIKAKDAEITVLKNLKGAYLVCDELKIKDKAIAEARYLISKIPTWVVPMPYVEKAKAWLQNNGNK